MILLSRSIVLHFASTQHIFHSPVLGTCFVCRLLFGEILCIRDSCVYQKCVLCFLILKVYVRSIEMYCFSVSVLRFQYSLQPEIFILQYIGCCVLIIRILLPKSIIIIIIIKHRIISYRYRIRTKHKWSILFKKMFKNWSWYVNAFYLVYIRLSDIWNSLGSG